MAERARKSVILLFILGIAIVALLWFVTHKDWGQEDSKPLAKHEMFEQSKPTARSSNLEENAPSISKSDSEQNKKIERIEIVVSPPIAIIGDAVLLTCKGIPENQIRNYQYYWGWSGEGKKPRKWLPLNGNSIEFIAEEKGLFGVQVMVKGLSSTDSYKTSVMVASKEKEIEF